MFKCLMSKKNLPKFFWAEIVNTIVYLLNLLLTKALKYKIPYEGWHGLKPLVDHLKVFKSLYYIYVSNGRRNKLDKRLESGIFVSYISVSKGYIIYKLKTKKIIISSNVKVDEQRT